MPWYLAIIALAALSLKPVEAKPTTRLHVWVSQINEFSKGQEAAFGEFERRHPGVEIREQLIPALPGEGSMDAQKLMCGVAGGAPPDLIEQDRFSIGDWASRGAFMPLDGLIAQTKGHADEIRRDDYFEACWAEAEYQGAVYAVPNWTDCRALYYNKDLLERFGLVDEDGAARPPRDWDELLEYAVRMTERDRSGNISRIGFIPNWGNSWLYLFGFQNGGEFMSPGGRTCTLDHPRIVEALEYMTKVYDALGGRTEVNVFELTFLPEAADAFLIDKVALRIDGDGLLYMITRYRPDMRFGVVPAPPPKGRPATTWSGGFSWAIPRGARYPELAWELIRWLQSEEGLLYQVEAQASYNASRGRPYIPRLYANRRVLTQQIAPRYAPRQENLREAWSTYLSLMPLSRNRPVTPVGQRLWDEHVRAFERGSRHIYSASEALRIGQQQVQAELDRLLEEKVHPPMRWDYVWWAVAALIAAAAIGIALYLRRHPVPRIHRREAAAGYAFASPWFVGFLFLMGGPIVFSFVLSFCEYDVLHPARFLGLENYRTLFTKDPLLWRSLWNTTYMVLSVPLTMAAGLGLALMVNKPIRGIAVYRTLYYMPAIVPVVAGSLLWMWLLNPRQGLINLALGWIGVRGPLWMSDPVWAKPGLILMLVWGSGAAMVIWLAGLKGIPEHLYESAKIDGAGPINRFLHVTVPMLSPYIFFNLIIGIIGTFQIFSQAYVMTSGGPADATMFYVYYLFNSAYKYLRFGYAAAMAWILFLIILALTLLNLKLAPRWVYYEGEER